MKTLMLRVCYLGVAVSTILASPGTEEPANAEPTDPIVDVQPGDLVADVVPQLKIADADALAETEVPAPLAPAAANTNAPAKRPVPLTEPTAPANVKLSPAMADVVKLVQAGVSPDVLMAYITNSGAVFNIDSDVIVYLNDLGVTNSVITALIQHDSSPETAARRASATAVQPLPPGVSTTAPVSNVYPPAANRTFPAAGQTTYPGDFSTVTDTNVDANNLPPAVATAPPAENVTVNYFYSSLAPYGSWVDVDGYGLCWRPTVAVADPYWQPYSDRGRWLWSDSGWYWYSDYTWGWAPFHYGRWCSYPRLGWLWVPGTVWAPSWVTWRYTGGYCGWAPLPPGCGYRSGIGLTWYGRGISLGFDFGLGWNCWSYVPTSHFCDWNVRRHCLPANRLHVVHNSAVAVNRFTGRNGSLVNHGIEPNTIASASRTKIPTMKIRDHALPTDARVKPERLENNGNTVAVVRPQLPKTAPAVANPVASRGTATRGRPMNLGSTAQATSPAATANPNRSPLAPNGNANVAPRPTPNNPLANGIARKQGNAQRHDNAATAPNPSPRVETPNRPAPTQPVARPPQASTPTPNVQRQAAPTPNAQRPTAPPQNVQRQAVPSPMARNNVNITPTPAPNAPTVGRNLAPPSSQQPAARPAPSQAAPAPRNVSPMIRSYAEPPRAAPPSVRQSPMAPPQFSAPRAEVSRPSVAPSAPSRSSAPSVSHSAPSVSRSAPSGGGGGGGGNRSGGGKGGRGD